MRSLVTLAILACMLVVQTSAADSIDRTASISVVGDDLHVDPGAAGTVQVIGNLSVAGSVILGNVNLGTALEKCEVDSAALRDDLTDTEARLSGATQSVNASLETEVAAIKSSLNKEVVELKASLASAADLSAIGTAAGEADTKLAALQKELTCLKGGKVWADGECSVGYPSCAHLPADSPSGYYEIVVDGTLINAYCEMRSVGGGWTLCGHGGGMPVTGGSNHWYGDYGDKRVQYTDSAQEATWCGKVPGIAEVMFTAVAGHNKQHPCRGDYPGAREDFCPKNIATLDFHQGFENRERNSLVVNWDGSKASSFPAGSRKIKDDIWAVEGSAVFYRKYDVPQTWASAVNAFSEHYYITYTDRGANNGDANENYYELGSHRAGKHQHYEEKCCGGGSYGDGQYSAGSFNMGGCRLDMKCMGKNNGHVFVYYRPTEFPWLKDHEKEAGATRCADLPDGSKSGMYNLRGVGIRYCEMDWAGGGWTLCAHAGDDIISGGSKHWYNSEAWGDHPHFSRAVAEGSVCGTVAKMDYVLWQVTDADVSPTSFQFVQVNWRGNKPDMDISAGSRNWPIQDDIYIPYSEWSVNQGSGVGNMYPRSETTWADSDMAFTEHFYLTYSDLTKSQTNHNDAHVYAYEIGAHKNGKHQHYEEHCAGGGLTGDGTINVGSFHMNGGCNEHQHYPETKGHVFIYYK